MTFNVLFIERDSNSLERYLPGSIRCEVARYSRAAVGGPEEAEIRASGDIRDLLLLLDWLRIKVFIDLNGRMEWWGYISRVEVEYENARISSDLERMSNRIAAAYTAIGLGSSSVGDRGTTDWAENAESSAIYGRKELLKGLTDTTATAAAAARDKALVELAYPRAGFEPRYTSGQTQATIFCKGWWQTLEWQYAPVETELALSFETIGSALRPIGKALTVDTFYQSFPVGGGGFNAEHVEIRCRKVGTPSAGLRVGLYSDDGGAPDTLLVSKLLDVADVPAAFDWVRFTFGSPETLAAGTYWVGIERSGAAEAEDYYEIEIDSSDSYADGDSLTLYDVEIAEGFDIAFRVYDESEVKQVSYEAYDLTRAVAELVEVDQVAQAFDVISDINLLEIGVYLKKVGSPADSLKIGIYSNPDDLTPTTELASVTVAAASIANAYGWHTISLSPAYLLTSGVSYFLVIERTGAAESANYYEVTLDAAEGYGAGPFVVFNSDSWIAYTGDMPFRLYSDVLIDTAQQVKSLIAAYGQFLRQVRVESSSGIISQSYRDGDSTARYEIEALLDIGTSNNRRMLAEVGQDRTVRIYEQASSSSYPYYISASGVITDYYGNPIDPADCPAGIWMAPKDLLPITGVQILGLQPFFVERVEYDALAGTARYQPSNLPDPFDIGYRNG